MNPNGKTKQQEVNYLKDDDEGSKHLEMKTLTEEDKDDYYFEDPSNIGTVYFEYCCVICAMLVLCQIASISTVTARNDIPVVQFPDHVTQMHQDRDRKFEIEYLVSKFCLFILFSILLIIIKFYDLVSG